MYEILFASRAFQRTVANRASDSSPSSSSEILLGFARPRPGPFGRKKRSSRAGQVPDAKAPLDSRFRSPECVALVAPLRETFCRRVPCENSPEAIRVQGFKFLENEQTVFPNQFAVEIDLSTAVLRPLNADQVPVYLAAVAVVCFLVGLARG